MQRMYIEVTSDVEFDQLFTMYGGNMIVDFGATWCGPCRTLAPRFKHMSERVQIVALSVDIDKCPSVARRYGITSVPKIIRFKNGNIYKQFTGNPPDNLIKDLMTV